MTMFVHERVNKGSYVQLLIISYNTLYCHFSVRDQIKFLAMQIGIIVVETGKDGGHVCTFFTIQIGN